MKYIATVYPMAKDPDDFVPQNFFTAYIDADDENGAMAKAENLGYSVWSIDECESSRGRLIDFLVQEIDRKKASVLSQEDHGSSSDIWRRAKLDTLKGVLRMAQGLEVTR